MEKELLLQQIGLNIKTIRTAKGITQQELAAAIDYEKSNMSRLEKGGTNPTIYTLYRVSQALDVDLGELLSLEK